MENISADIIRKAALELPPRDVLSLCLSKKSFSKMICDSDVFWRNKIKIDYPRETYSLEIYQQTPKKLYMLLTISKIIYLKKEDLDEKINDYDDDEDNDLNDLVNIAEIITNYIRSDVIFTNNIKRGDVLYLAWRAFYRNDNKFLWDGEKAVVLDYENDDYELGPKKFMVPKEFAFPEFRPGYFSKIINNIVRLSPKKVQEVKDNFDITTQTSYVTDKYNKYIVKLNLDIPDIDIKFDKIFLDDYLEYEDGVFVLNIKMISSHFSEWKNAIINPEYTFEWEENTLIIKKI